MTTGFAAHPDPEESRELAVRAELERVADVLGTGLALLRDHGARLDATATAKVLERLQEQTDAIARLAASLGPQELVLPAEATIVLTEPPAAPAEEALVATIGGHLAVELRLGGSALVVATPARRAEIEADIAGRGFPLDTLARAGRYRWLDADAVAAAVTGDDGPEGRRFDEVIGRLARSMRSPDFGLRTYCEVPVLLRAQGRACDATSFERLWGELATDDGRTWLGGRELHVAA